MPTKKDAGIFVSVEWVSLGPFDCEISMRIRLVLASLASLFA